MLLLGNDLLLLQVVFSLIVELINLNHLADDSILVFHRFLSIGLCLSCADIDAVLSFLLLLQVHPVNSVGVDVVL